MELSVVVSTLNDRERLLSCLDALEAETPPGTEIVVVNGPSSDGTTGVVRERADVDVLVEISERNPNVSRNAGFEVATGEIVAFLDAEYAIEPGWYEALEDATAGGSDVVAGPTREADGTASESERTQRIVGRSVTVFDGGNVAFDQTSLEALDGFDEYLESDGARDCAHRVGGLGFEVAWSPSMAVRSDVGADGGQPDPEWGTTYRALAYGLGKNYGPRPTVLGRTVGSALRDGLSGVREIVTGDATPTGWFSNGVDVVTNAAGGFKDGVRARYADRSTRRNPNGLSVRHDRAVRIYDRR
ncbi:glycosyltransferase family 2 protein [Natronococcus sp. A-GB7]|uniref:glycosyltransferase family 2 protein n=1 Tax=Natronococcus sp. A-GB7 TaxID=3037649 RepID=UPI00241D641A|nr:glycosyltransferase family 2 protein [Natronococcus sp. A-GB7]MDG5817563.1 glycosyltransferase family 2 protein [Natronococcus sp. A-GB7]